VEQVKHTPEAREALVERLRKLETTVERNADTIKALLKERDQQREPENVARVRYRRDVMDMRSQIDILKAQLTAAKAEAAKWYRDALTGGALAKNEEYKRGLQSFGIELTKEQAELIKHKEIKIYQTDGQTLFKIRGSDKYMMYITFVD